MGNSCGSDKIKNFIRNFFRFTPQQIEANTRRINLLYGGYLPNVTNVYFTQGELDPWKPMGREIDLNEHAPAFVIPRKIHDSFFLSQLIQQIFFYAS